MTNQTIDGGVRARRKLTNWSSELTYSAPRSQMLDGPRPAIPEPNKTPFKPEGVSRGQ